MSAQQRTSFELVVHATSYELRAKYGLVRLEAEWFCFRMISTIKTRYMEDYVPSLIAANLYDLWKQPNIQNEFAVLLRGIKDMGTSTTEVGQCKHMNVKNSGPEPASNGIARKSKRRN